jgi:hypothetical protein
MTETLDLGRRVELVSMDPHFHAVSIALYRRLGAREPSYLVHSYSKRAGVGPRLRAVARAMTALGGLEALPGAPLELRFACGAEHALACRRVFLEACKLPPDQPAEPRPLTILDKKSGRTIRVVGVGAGAYRLTADGDDADQASRIAAVANGLIKLGEMRRGGAGSDRVAFDCGQAHDALVGLLLVRALNVRAVLREEEMAAARGVLAAPSAQQS